MQILNERQIEETAIAVYLVSDGIDQCRVGFLQRHMLKYGRQYGGVLAQVTEVYCADSESPMKRKKYHRNRGCCLAAIISSIPAEATPSMTTAQQYRTNPLETPPQKRDNESSGSRGEAVSSAAEDDITDVCTSSEQDADVTTGQDKLVDDNGPVRDDDESTAGELATVATRKRKKAKMPPMSQGSSSTSESVTAAKKTRTTEALPESPPKQAYAAIVQTLSWPEPWFSDNSNDEDYVDESSST